MAREPWRTSVLVGGRAGVGWVVGHEVGGGVGVGPRVGRLVGLPDGVALGDGFGVRIAGDADGTGADGDGLQGDGVGGVDWVDPGALGETGCDEPVAAGLQPAATSAAASVSLAIQRPSGEVRRVMRAPCRYDTESIAGGTLAG